LLSKRTFFSFHKSIFYNYQHTSSELHNAERAAEEHLARLAEARGPRTFAAQVFDKLHKEMVRKRYFLNFIQNMPYCLRNSEILSAMDPCFSSSLSY